MFDRELPGRGRGVAPALTAALLAGGYQGWWKHEVFSDDGTFGEVFPDSYWKMPHEQLLEMVSAAFDACYTGAIELNRAEPDWSAWTLRA